MKHTTNVPAQTVDPGSRCALLLAWKTASRWAETSALTRRNVILMLPDEIIIDWGRLPKSARQNPFRPSRHAVVQGSWTQEIFLLLHAWPTETPLSRLTTQQISTLLSAAAGRKLTAHSVKRGAIDVLLTAVAAGKLPGEAVALLAKHQTPGVVPSMTARYAGNAVTLARAQGTAAATTLL
jgi:hypothetical protein